MHLNTGCPIILARSDHLSNCSRLGNNYGTPSREANYSEFETFLRIQHIFLKIKSKPSMHISHVCLCI